MARKGGRKGGSSAARSAAAKKGWETRRRGGAKSKPAATKRTAASKPAAKSAGKAPASRQSQFASRAQRALGNLKSAKGTFKTYASQPYWQRGLGDQRPYQKALRSEVTAKAALKVYAGKKRPTVSDARVRNTSKARPSSALGAAGYKPLATRLPSSKRAKPAAKPAAKTTKRRGGMPKTTSARGRALTNQRRAADLVRASRGGKGPSAKAVRSVLTAQRARAFYAATGGGKKRSAVKAKSAAKIGKSIRAQGRAKATAARAKVAGRQRAGAVRTTRNGDARQRALINYNNALRKTASLDAGKKSDVAFATARRALDVYAGKKPSGRPIGFTSRVRPSSGSTNVKAAQYRRIGEGSIEPGATRKLLQSRAQVLRQASSATGLQRRTLLGMSGRQAEGLSISGNAPNRTGRGNNQLTRAGRRAAANYVRIERALVNTPAGASRKKLQRRLDTAFAALASLPKTRLPR